MWLQNVEFFEILLFVMSFVDNFKKILETYCSARDWDRIRITWGYPQSGCSDICSYLMGHCRCTRAYVTKRNSGMKQVKCG